MYKPVLNEYTLQIRQRKENNVRKFELILRRTKNIGQKKKRRVVSNHKKGRMAAAFFGMLMTGTLLLSGMEMQVSAQTIRHEHLGDAQNGGECFADAVYHVHEGNEEEGGSCYNTPVYHVHTGNGVNGGGCYGEEIRHVHQGSENQAGACYTPVYHSHGNSCYAQRSHDASCSSHFEFHPYDCIVHDWDGDGHGCDGYTVYDCDGHWYIGCGSDGQIVGYQFSCSMADGQITGYRMNCSKTNDTIEAYELSCTKTPDDIDYYENTCGMEEGQEITIPDPPEETTPDDGNTTGQEESENGNGEQENQEQGGGQTPGSEPEQIPESEPEYIPEVIPAPSELPAMTPAPSELPVEEVILEATVRKKPAAETAKTSPAREKVTSSPEPVRQVTPKPVAEETVKLPEVAAEPGEEGGEPVVLKRKWPVFTPVIKMISITSGTVVLLIALILLLLYLRRSVRVYNDNGKGRMQYLGRAGVTLSEEGYCVQITERLVERASTNRYCIRPDLFLIGKNNSYEIWIVKDGKRKSVYLDKEMNFTI